MPAPLALGSTPSKAFSPVSFDRGVKTTCAVYALTRALGHSEVFCPLTETPQIIETWQGDSSENRPPKAFDKNTPNEFADGIAFNRDPIGLHRPATCPGVAAEEPIWSM